MLDLKLFDAQKLEPLRFERRQCALALGRQRSAERFDPAAGHAVIKKLMSEELLRPDLQLRVVKPRPIRVVLWASERPGIYSLTTVRPARPKAGQKFG